MDRSRRPSGNLERQPEGSAVPAASRLTVRKKNRRRPASLWSRMPKPRAMADACGRAVRRGVPAIVASSALAVIGTGLWVGYQFVTTSDRFAIDDIEIRGNVRMTADQIRAALPIHLGDNVFTADLGDITARLRAEPWIASAEARRVLPDTIIVDVREYQAAVVVAFGDSRYLADPAGRPFKRITADEGIGLPLVTGLSREAYRKDPDAIAHQVIGALDVLRAWADATRPPIVHIHVDPRGFTLRDQQLSIQLGEGQLTDRLRTFDAVWAALGTDERARARVIHLDTRSYQETLDPAHVTVAFSPT